MKAIAPGKVMLAGEYSVLHGHDALVMAIDRYARAEITTAPTDNLPPETLATLASAREAKILHREHWIAVDTRALTRDGYKLGLGSSAAGCVAALAATMMAEGEDVDKLRPTIARIARRAHQHAQGGGSGVDVLASTYGGVLHVQFPDGLRGEPVVTTLSWPSTVAWAVLWTGVPVRTSDFIRAVRALQARDPTTAQRWIDTIRDATSEMIHGFSTHHAEQVVQAVRRHAGAMDALGRAAGIELVTEEMRRFATVIEPLGAAMKPSGAGGGDIVLLVAKDHATLDTATAQGETLGWTRLELSIDARGVRATVRTTEGEAQ